MIHHVFLFCVNTEVFFNPRLHCENLIAVYAYFYHVGGFVKKGSTLRKQI